MNARRLKPSELARQDQYLAAAAHFGQENLRALVLTTWYASPGTRCCWCDCPDDVPHPGPLGCAGCPEGAYYAVRGSHGVFSGQDLPICEPHYADFQRMVAAGFKGPVAVTGVDILDSAT